MKKILTAIALAIAIPAVAQAQAAPAPAPKADCCEKMKAEGKDSCKDMAKMDHDMQGMKDMPAGHVMPSGNAPAATTHQNHQ